ncbi:PTS transporter subunit EIIC [Clostridium tetanomorphum]|uniref:PTS transporter subunit EIIC n=1 Tax=Clostridium tetanomorphum TaxID=1553 RepID=UPI000D9FA63D|nr:PTS transporter subunit EIIC [Clostridium tetanomorphum]SQC02935.1 phosphotransferase system, EIIC [Clostridium tetanomorphum]
MIFGPIGTLLGNVLANLYSIVYNFSPVMAGVCLGFLIQIMVIFGFHWSLVPLAINNIALYGYDTILALMGPAAFAQAGAAFAVYLKTNNRNLKTVSLSATISAIFGVTEPALFGVNLPLKKPMIFVCIGGAIGGGIAGATGASAISFAFPGLATLPVFLGKGFIGFVLACTVGLIISFLLTFSIKFEDQPIKIKS